MFPFHPRAPSPHQLLTYCCLPLHAQAGSSGAESEAALRDAMTATVKQVEQASAEAQRVAVSEARRSWDSMREAERKVRDCAR